MAMAMNLEISVPAQLSTQLPPGDSLRAAVFANGKQRLFSQPARWAIGLGHSCLVLQEASSSYAPKGSAVVVTDGQVDTTSFDAHGMHQGRQFKLRLIDGRRFDLLIVSSGFFVFGGSALQELQESGIQALEEWVTARR